MLEALVRKTETIQRQLGSAGQVIAERITQRLTAGGIARDRARQLADEIAAEADDERVRTAREEIEDADTKRLEKVKSEIGGLRRSLERARVRVGVEPDELRRVVEIALHRARFPLQEAKGEPAGAVETFAIDPQHPAFARDPAWQDAFDDLRARRRGRRERVNEWRRAVPPRAIAFEPPVLPDGRDADNVVQVHLEHRLVRRLLGRFLSQGFQSDLHRACVILGPGAQPRVVLLGRIALYGPGASRLHEEILPVTALWTESGRGTKPLRALGRTGEETTLDQLEAALTGGRRPSDAVIGRALSFAHQDIVDLLPALQERAGDAIAKAEAQLTERGLQEAASLEELLHQQRQRIAKADAGFDDRQLKLPGIAEAERRQMRADRAHCRAGARRPARTVARFPRHRKPEPIGGLAHTKSVANPIAEMRRLIAKDPRNAERIFPYIGGEEVNTSPTHAHHRYVINFEDFPLERKDLGAGWRRRTNSNGACGCARELSPSTTPSLSPRTGPICSPLQLNP